VLVRETYPDKDVAALFEKSFIAVKVNAGKDDGRALAQRFGVQGYPTLLITDAKGEEVDRLIGFRPPKKIIPELQDILGGKSFAALKKLVEKDASDFKAAVALANKLRERDDDASAEELYRKVSLAAAAPAELRRDADGELAVIAYFKSRGRDAGALESFFEKHRDSPAALTAAQLLVGHYDRKGEEEKLASTVEHLVKHSKDASAADILNSISWTWLEKGKRPKLALTMAKKAVELDPKNAAILDTLAVAFSKNGLAKEALETQRKAVELAPESLRKELEGRLKELEEAAKEDKKPSVRL